jgi:hypothetical protein
MESVMNKFTRVLDTMAIAVVLVFGAAACGAGAGGGPTGRPAIVPSGKPISLEELVDVSETTEAQDLRRQYLAAAMEGVEAVLLQGGSLSIDVFFSHGLHPVVLLRTQVPTPGQASGVARAEKVIPIREAAETALGEALELGPRRPEVAAALSGMGGESTDVAGALADALEEAEDAVDPVVLMITDGEDGRLTHHYGDPPGALAGLISPSLPRARPASVVGMFGIGASASGSATAMNRRLVAAWRLACARSGSRCLVSPSLEADRLFAAPEGE